MRRFYFNDASGAVMMEGVQFSDGAVIAHRLGKISSIYLYEDVVEFISAQEYTGGRFRWLDDDVSYLFDDLRIQRR